MEDGDRSFDIFDVAAGGPPTTRGAFLRQGAVVGVSTTMLGTLLAACGGSSSSSSSSSSSPAAGASSAAVSSTAPAASSSASTAAAGKALKVGFIYSSPVGDAGWSDSHDMGRKYLAAHMAGVTTTAVENVAQDADVKRVMTQMLGNGTDLIFACSVGMLKTALDLGSQVKVPIMVASGYQTAPMVGNYMASTHEAFYLAGYVAASMSKSGKLGWVASFPFAEFIRDADAFALGARAAKPDSRVTVVWTSTFYDPTKESNAALSLIDAGCDVVAQEQDSPGVQQAAQSRGVYSISSNTDMRKFAPKAVLTGSLYTWGPYYQQVAEAVAGGSWKPDSVFLGIKEGVVDIAPYGDSVPADLRSKTDALKSQIRDGSLPIFKGPIKDQSGKVRIPDGQVWTAKDTSKFDFLLDNMVGSTKA